LGPTEYKLLRHFIENPGRVYSREQLLDSVWGHGIYVESRTVDTHIRRLRKAIDPSGQQNYIRTVRSAGYSMDND
jgi:two-component system phosphate regulon response regulator PhoB